VRGAIVALAVGGIVWFSWWPIGDAAAAYHEAYGDYPDWTAETAAISKCMLSGGQDWEAVAAARLQISIPSCVTGRQEDPLHSAERYLKTTPQLAQIAQNENDDRAANARSAALKQLSRPMRWNILMLAVAVAAWLLAPLLVSRRV
jgi:hypothetical protein